MPNSQRAARTIVCQTSTLSEREKLISPKDLKALGNEKEWTNYKHNNMDVSQKHDVANLKPQNGPYL